MIQLPNITIDEAEKLAWETDYACFAVEEPNNEINKADAGAFFLEGYNYANRRIDNLIKEKLHEFIDFHNESHPDKYIPNSELGLFLNPKLRDK